MDHFGNVAAVGANIKLGILHMNYLLDLCLFMAVLYQRNGAYSVTFSHRKEKGHRHLPVTLFASVFVILQIASGGKKMAAGAAFTGGQSAGLTGPAAHVDEYIHPVAAFGAPDFREPGGVLSFVTAVQKHGVPP
jgi:hypothetical protein